MNRIRMNRRRTDFDHLWLITFADLMVQLMAFFALAYNLQNRNQGTQMQQVLEGLRKALGVPTAQLEPQAPLGPGVDPNKAADLEKLMNDLKATDGPEEGRKLRLVTFRGSLLYQESSIALDPVFIGLVDRIAALAKEYPGFQLVCQGHAAPGERARNGGDALELSAQRAAATARLLADRGVDPAALTVEARGDHDVEADTRTPEGRALCRQVKFRFQRIGER